MSSIGILLPGSIAHACPIPIVVDWCQCNKRNLERPAVYCISVWLQEGAIAWQAQIFARCLWVWGQRYARRHVCHLQGKDMQVPPCPDMPLDQLKCHVTIGFGETRQGVVNIASNWSAFRAKECRSGVELFHFIHRKGAAWVIPGSDRMYHQQGWEVSRHCADQAARISQLSAWYPSYNQTCRHSKNTFLFDRA